MRLPPSRAPTRVVQRMKWMGHSLSTTSIPSAHALDDFAVGAQVALALGAHSLASFASNPHARHRWVVMSNGLEIGEQLPDPLGRTGGIDDVLDLRHGSLLI
jgi:hypothetical protein